MARQPVPESWLVERLRPWGHQWPGLPRRPGTMVVGIDGSDSSLMATDWAAKLAKTVHLVHGLGLYDLPRGEALAPELGAAWMHRIEVDAKNAVSAAYARLAGHTVRDHRSNDSPARAILHVADTMQADVVATGHAGRGLLDRLVLGSVSEALAHRADVPLLVAKTPPREGAILCGVGDDAGTPYALAWAAALATWLERELLVVHASPAHEELEDFDSLNDGYATRLVAWPARRGLVDAIEAADAALVVLGHGRRPGWLGSTAIGLLRRSPCSVLITRPWIEQDPVA